MRFLVPLTLLVVLVGLIGAAGIVAGRQKEE